MEEIAINDGVEQFIRKYDIERRCAITHEMARALVYRSMLNNSFAFILGDVVNSFIRDCEYDMDKFDKGFSENTKYYYNQMMKCIKGARKWSDMLTKPMYDNKAVDDLCHDSDFWYSLIRLIDDRIGNDPQKTNQLLEFLLNMPEGNSPYKVTINDFKTL